MTQPQPPAGGQRVPANADDAVEIVLEQFARPYWPDGTPAPLHTHEFEEGYLVYASQPPRDARMLPPEPGGSQFVVRKSNGDVTTVPNYPAQTAIETYRKFYRPSGSEG